MADHTMFERVKDILTRTAPTRNIQAPALRRSLRDTTRNYASVGVLVAFVGGVTGPALLAGTDDPTTAAVQPASSAIVQDARAGASPDGGGTAGSADDADSDDTGDRAEAEGGDGGGPAGGGEPAPKSGDPEGESTPADAEKDDGGEPAEQKDEPAPAEAADAQADAEGGGAAPAPVEAVEPVDELDGWIRSAIGILQDNGTPVSDEHVDEIRTIIEKESSGDPRAINNWDINAVRGTPSKGLMQTIDPTFDAYKLPGHGEIYDPVDNIIAGVRYTFDRYGGFAEHPGLASMAQGGGYQGY